MIVLVDRELVYLKDCNQLVQVDAYCDGALYVQTLKRGKDEARFWMYKLGTHDLQNYSQWSGTRCVEQESGIKFISNHTKWEVDLGSESAIGTLVGDERVGGRQPLSQWVQVTEYLSVAQWQLLRALATFRGTGKELFQGMKPHVESAEALKLISDLRPLYTGGWMERVGNKRISASWINELLLKM